MNDTKFSIRHSIRAMGSKCALTGAYLNDRIEGWFIGVRGQPISEAAIDQSPADLRAMVEELNRAPFIAGEHQFSIVAVDATDNKACPVGWMTGAEIWRGEGAQWGVGTCDYASRLLGIEAAWRLTPTLAEMLHRHGQLPECPVPAETPAPAPKAPPTQQEIRTTAIRRFASTLANDGIPGRAELRRAEIRLEAIEKYLGAQ